MNNLTIIGRLVSDPQINETEDGKYVSNMTLSVQRYYKNENGEYEKDLIPVKFWGYFAENTCKHYHKGDLIGIKGKLQNIDNNIVVIADKVTFLQGTIEEEE